MSGSSARRRGQGDHHANPVPCLAKLVTASITVTATGESPGQCFHDRWPVRRHMWRLTAIGAPQGERASAARRHPVADLPGGLTGQGAFMRQTKEDVPAVAPRHGTAVNGQEGRPP